MLKIEELKKEQITQIAKIHKQFLSNGFLATLPINILEKFYLFLFRSSHSFTFVAVDNHKVIGFVTATTDIKRLPKYLLLALWKEMLFITAKNPFTLKNILQLPFYPSFNNSLNSCEVLSLAVIPKKRSGGVGHKLMSKVTNNFKNRGYHKFQLSVRADMLNANAFYKKIGLKKIKSSKFLGNSINFWQGEC